MYVQGHACGRDPNHGDKGLKGPHGCSQPCMDTAQYCSKTHLWVPHPTLVSQLGPTAQTPPGSGVGGCISPYGEVLVGV